MPIDKANKQLPREPTEAMVRAIEAHYEKWQRILGYTDAQVKAQCWDALQTYYRMWDAA
jgi:hypothetical protein